MDKKKVIIIGAGPAGLTAGYELLTRSNEYDVTILEADSQVGGISKTVNRNGNRMDIGGHRFFSKDSRVNSWWESMLKPQGAPAYDDKLLGRNPVYSVYGVDPETEDKVMLKRGRLSRIFFNGKFYDYPISLKFETFKNMGLVNTILCGFSYLGSMIHKREEKSLEDFYINRFGRKLYSMFFEHYTENLWGRHPSQIAPSWGAQRVKGVSVSAAIKNALNLSKEKETSFIEEFLYPKYGPGQMWETVADRITQMGGNIFLNTEVTEINNTSDHITDVVYKTPDYTIRVDADIVISSMPLKDLVTDMTQAPSEKKEIAENLPYRDYITIGVLLPKLDVNNKTSNLTLGDYIPDNWIYVHDRSVKLGRVQIYNNWSPYLVKDPKNTVWLGLEYFCNEGDDFWNSTEEQFYELAKKELVKIGFISDDTPVLDIHVEKVKKAYPAYFDSYDRIEELKEFLNSIDNLWCVGRNGQHRYNNMDHSMLTAMLTVDNILSGTTDKSEIWAVNTEKQYHEKSSCK